MLDRHLLLAIAGLLLLLACTTLPNYATGLSGGGSSPLPTYLGQVATRGQYPGYSPTQLGSIRQIQSRIQHVARDNVRNPQLVFVGYWGSTETAVGADMYVSSSIEYPVGTFSRITCGGLTFCRVPGGGTVTTDPVAVGIPIGSQFREWTYAASSVGIPTFPTTRRVDAGQYVTTTTPSIDMTEAGGSMSATDWAYGATAILGQTGRATACLFGDSRTESTYDARGSNDGGNLASSIGVVAGYINLAVGGENVFQQRTQSRKRRAFTSYCSHIYIATGINSLTGSTAASTLSELAGLVALFSPKPVYVSTIEPYTSGTAPVASLTSFGTTATATVANTVGMAVGQSVTVAGATPTGYNGTFTVKGLSAASFDYTVAAGLATPAAGAITFGDGFYSAASQRIDPVAGVTAKIDSFNDAIRANTIAGVSGYNDLNVVARHPLAPQKWDRQYTDSDGLHGNERYISAVRAQGAVYLRPLIAPVSP